MKQIDLKEFREKGYLQEANRQFFHPLGLKLAWNPTADALFVIDERDEDNEGGWFSDETIMSKAAKNRYEFVNNELLSRKFYRVKKFGAVVQQLQYDGDE